MKYKIESCTKESYCLEWKVYYKEASFLGGFNLENMLVI